MVDYIFTLNLCVSVSFEMRVCCLLRFQGRRFIFRGWVQHIMVDLANQNAYAMSTDIALMYWTVKSLPKFKLLLSYYKKSRKIPNPIQSIEVGIFWGDKYANSMHDHCCNIMIMTQACQYINIIFTHLSYLTHETNFPSNPNTDLNYLAIYIHLWLGRMQEYSYHVYYIIIKQWTGIDKWPA